MPTAQPTQYNAGNQIQSEYICNCQLPYFPNTRSLQTHFSIVIVFCQEILVYLQQNISSDKLAFTLPLELFIYDLFLFSTMVWYLKKIKNDG